MWPFLGGLVSGAGSLLGGLFTSEQSGKNTQAQIQASQQQQATQNAFTEQMSNTAYQRASKDMQEAGLNPAMMFGSGSAASTPAGSGIQAPMPQTRHPLESLGDAAGKAVSTAISVQTFDKMVEEIANLKTQRAKIEADVDLSRAHGSESTARTKLAEIESQLRTKRLPGAEFEEKTAKDLLEMPDTARKMGNIGAWSGNKAGDILAPITSTANSVLRALPRKRETIRSGSRWNSRGEENHYEDSTFEKRFYGH